MVKGADMINMTLTEDERRLILELRNARTISDRCGRPITLVVMVDPKTTMAGAVTPLGRYEHVAAPEVGGLNSKM